MHGGTDAVASQPDHNQGASPASPGVQRLSATMRRELGECGQACQRKRGQAGVADGGALLRWPAALPHLQAASAQSMQAVGDSLRDWAR
eukprot:COSAG06_NODE_28851_length_566_cov_5.449679_1_plen_88_part_10